MQIFKRREVLTKRQLQRAKWTIGAATAILMVQFVSAEVTKFMYGGTEYDKMMVTYFPRGSITEFTNNEEFCSSWVLTPGVSILPWYILAIFYFFWLVYLFLGIGVISDIFMEAIEVITSQTKVVAVPDPMYPDVMKPTKVPVWNPTFANLTLMALGSSAPEILLNCIETVATLGATPGELGASTIVGSASFNFLVISGVSIYAVNTTNDNRTDDEIADDGTGKGVKKVFDLGVFAITTTWSVVAYMWLFYVLLDYEVTTLEAGLTFAFFWILIIMAVGADIYNKKANNAKMEAKLGLESAAEGRRELTIDEQKQHAEKAAPRPADAVLVNNYGAYDFYNTLLPAEKGEAPANADIARKQEEMKDFLQKEFGTTKVSLVDKEELKEKLGGITLLERTKYRKQVAIGNAKEAIAKGAVIRKENKLADTLSESQRNEDFGFQCLHYSVSEGAGVLRVKILNRNGKKKNIGVRTIDAEACSPKDYGAVDEVIEFTEQKKSHEITIKIEDDDQWEPDEDFYVELYDVATKERLYGEDTRTRVTIMDDDRPGMLAFAETKTHRHIHDQTECRIVIKRTNGSDGDISLEYETFELDKSPNTATPGVHYEHIKGELKFKHREVEAEIVVKIIQDVDMKEGTKRDEVFGVKIFNPKPDVVKISKKNSILVEIVTDAETKKQAEALQQLLDRINREENVTWGQQILNAVMLHPTKDEDGEITEVTAGEAILHFLSVGWKVLFAFCPPPHVWGGVPCFFIALCFIGVVTAIVGEVAALMGCVIGLKPGITAITFVAIGTSLPDTFASMTAARESRYADSAVGNVTGSNSVNVFLGLGLPWVIAVIYETQFSETNTSGAYRYPAKGLDLSVLLFLICSLVGIVILITRRIVVKGELGGGYGGRVVSCLVFCSLWVFYITISALYQLEVIEVNLLEPPAWYTCAKTPESDTCNTFCMDSFNSDAKLDSECVKVCENKRDDETYGWCVAPASEGDAQDATDNNNAAEGDGSNPEGENAETDPVDPSA